MWRLQHDDYPLELRRQDFHGGVYRLDEPVLDIASVVRALAGVDRDALLHGHVRAFSAHSKTLSVQTVNDDALTIQAQCVIFTAGAGNADFSPVAMQRRPLHMVLARGRSLPPLYVHCLGLSDTPRITITSHPDDAGTTVWYVGGQLAENGVERDAAGQIDSARHELAELLPWIDLSAVGFSTLMIDRAEAAQRHGKRPAGLAVAYQDGHIVAWPTKLALAPLLADEILALLEGECIAPARPMPKLPGAWAPPRVHYFPWQQPGRLWS
jgi:hypothetical protein